MRRLLSTSLLISSIVLAPPTAGAQSVSLDATIGRSNGHSGGEYMDNQRGMSADVLLAVGFGGAGGGRMVAGLNGSLHGTGTYAVACAPHPAGGCVRAFPQFELLGAVVGWQSGGSRLRAAVGAASARAYGDWHEWHLAWQGRLDGALPIIPHIAAVASVRGTLVPEYRGDSVRLLALGVGLRIH